MAGDLMQAALESVTCGGSVPVELIPRHRAAVRLGVWPRSVELTGYERELVLARFRPGPRSAVYGAPFEPLPQAVCDVCGRGVHQPQSPAGRSLDWVHDVSPVDLHRPAVFGQPPPPVLPTEHPYRGVNTRARARVGLW